ncbi:MAG TPA: hypothetical protein ENN29_13610 [Candidatus Hydrogenedentes bacterium]|nr:hypothetical protein [Candidatus Hydrogenedentota bacterium]
MSLRNSILTALIVAGLVLGAGYILGLARTEPAPDAEETETPPPVAAVNPDPSPAGEPEEEAPKIHITREMVEKMYYGLSYEDAAQLFGATSDEWDTEYNQGVEGYTSPFIIHWHVWKNEDGSKARLGFVNKKLERKQYIAADGDNLLPEAPHTDVENYGHILGIE